MGGGCWEEKGRQERAADAGCVRRAQDDEYNEQSRMVWEATEAMDASVEEAEAVTTTKRGLSRHGKEAQ